MVFSFLLQKLYNLVIQLWRTQTSKKQKRICNTPIGDNDCQRSGVHPFQPFFCTYIFPLKTYNNFLHTLLLNCFSHLPVYCKHHASLTFTRFLSHSVQSYECTIRLNNLTSKFFTAVRIVEMNILVAKIFHSLGINS